MRNHSSHWLFVLACALLTVSAQLPFAHGSFGRIPSSQGGFGSGASFGRVSSDVDVRDAVEGIAGLMQRFERVQPQLNRIPPAELNGVVVDGQALHERFVELQQNMRGATGAAGHEARLMAFHRDLAVYVERVEARLGIGFGGNGGGSPPALGGASAQRPPPQLQRAAAFGASTPGFGMPSQQQASFGSSAIGMGAGSAEQRLQQTMRSVVDAMQRFEALHPRLSRLSEPIFNQVAARGQQLHEEFLALQRRGVELSGSGSGAVREADLASYAASMEAFAVAQGAFVKDTEEKVRDIEVGGVASVPYRGATAFGGSGLSSSRLTSSGGLSSGVGGFVQSVGLNPPSFSGGSPAFQGSGFAAPRGDSACGGFSATGGVITPATDAHLSATIKKIVDLMQEFERMKPAITRLAPQLVDHLARQGQALHERFVVLQQQGAALAGDGTRNMLEREASAYTSSLEAFYKDQEDFVEKAKQSVSSPSGGAPFASGITPPGGASLPVGFGTGGLPTVGLPSTAGTGSLKGAGFGTTFGSAGFGTNSLHPTSQRPIGSANSPLGSTPFGGCSTTHFSGGASVGLGTKGFAPKGPTGPDLEAAVQKELRSISRARLDTSVLPRDMSPPCNIKDSGSEVCSKA